eukprot:gene11519-biopygen3183
MNSRCGVVFWKNITQAVDPTQSAGSTQPGEGKERDISGWERRRWGAAAFDIWKEVERDMGDRFAHFVDSAGSIASIRVLCSQLKTTPE